METAETTRGFRNWHRFVDEAAGLWNDKLSRNTLKAFVVN